VSAQILAAMGRAYVRFAVENPEHFGVMFADGVLATGDPEYIEATDRCFEPLVEIVRRAAREGYVDDDPMLVAASAWSLVHGVAALWLSGRLQARTGVSDATALADHVTRFFVDRIFVDSVTRAPKSQLPISNR
jgi:hypothetical protein